MEYQFRQAKLIEISKIWDILKNAIERRKKEGSNQWQDGYPNINIVKNDITKNAGYVLTHNKSIIGYCAVFINDEPEYANIEGKWLTDNDFIVYHRVAVAENYLGKGCAKLMLEKIEEFALENKILSVKADTNFDNEPMKAIFTKLGYVYCGKVYFRGSSRKAYEKVLVESN